MNIVAKSEVGLNFNDAYNTSNTHPGNRIPYHTLALCGLLNDKGCGPKKVPASYEAGTLKVAIRMES